MRGGDPVANAGRDGRAGAFSVSDRPSGRTSSGFQERELSLHGHRTIYHLAGSGPPVVLIHGMLNSSRHWQAVASRLAPGYTVIAPDLIGHGDSAAPRCDYSLGAQAASIRDLLAAIGVQRATIVGHSLGGGVAMQFFYQFPQRVQRMVLISSGGLGLEVSPLLRTAALPGVSALLSLAAHPRVLAGAWAIGDRLRRGGVSNGASVQAVVRALRPLEDAQARESFLQTLRAVIDVHGQRVQATDRLYLLESIPTLIVWGQRDRTIPLEHANATHRAVPHSVLKTLPDAAHFPHLEDPKALSETLLEFLASTEPGSICDGDWGNLLGYPSGQ